VAPVLEFIETRIPSDATVSLALRGDDFGYPAFGPRLERRVDLVPDEPEGSAGESEWLIASPAHTRELGSCWASDLETPDGWTIFRRSC
jgi:hypothetical protein